MKISSNRFFRKIGLGALLLVVMTLFVLETPNIAEADHFTEPMNVEIKIKKVNSIGCPDDWFFGCGNADYQLFVELDNVRHEYPNNSDGYVDDENHISPNWIAPDSSNPHGPLFGNDQANLKIGLWEVDGGLRFGDDHMDISPQGSKDIIGELRWDHEDFTWARVVLPGGDGPNDLLIELDPILPCCFGVTDYVLKGTSGNSDWRAKVTLDITIKEAPGIGVEEAGAKVRPIAIHSPLHPESDDDLTITGAIIDEWGKRVDYDTLQIWIDPDGKNPHDDAYILTGNGNCWQDGTSSGSICEETIDLSTIPEPSGLADDEQRMIAYGVRAQDAGDHTAWVWSDWRLTTIGNRTNSSFIGFSLGTGSPRNAVDYLYTGHAKDYGATGCSNQPVLVYPAGSPIPLYVTSTPQCSTPMNAQTFTSMVRDNWTNTFMSAEQWSPTHDYRLVTRGKQMNDSQRWILTDLGSNTYTIRQKINNRYLDAYETADEDFSVVTRPVQNNNTQRWILKDLGNNTYTIKQKSSGRYLDAYEEDSDYGATSQPNDYRLVTRQTQMNDSQRWILTDLGSNTYTIQQKINTRYVDAYEDDKPSLSGYGANYGFTHLDVIAQNLDKMNFWYTPEPAIGEGFSDGCDLSTPKILTTDPDTGLVTSASSYGWFEVAFVLHETPWRDCAPYGGKKVTIERLEYPTTLHETGHRPFGLSDQYCCDGGYSQVEYFPNVYKELDGYTSILFDDVPGCLDDPSMGNDGVPYPKSLIGCEEIISTHAGSWDWYSPQQTAQGLSTPNGELMSQHRATGIPVDADSVSDVPPGLGAVRVQAGPQTTKRILWFLSRCESGAC